MRADFSVKLWLENGKKKFSADLCDWAILSQIIDADTGGTEINIHIPHFSSLGSSYESLWLNHEDSAATFLRTENSSVLSGDASCSRPPNSMEASSTNNSGSLSSQGDERYGNCILERLAISILAEKPLLRDEDCEDSIIQGWVGNGSVAGLNVTISLSEIQVGVKSSLFYLRCLTSLNTIFILINLGFHCICHLLHLVKPLKHWEKGEKH